MMAQVAINVVEHEHSHAISEAAHFLVNTPPESRPAPLVPALREMFGLSAVEVCVAIAESHKVRRGLR